MAARRWARGTGTGVMSGLVWVLLLGWAVLWGLLLRTPSGVSWHFFPEGAGLLFGDSGLRLYAQHPLLQIGPLTFVAVEPLTWLPRQTGLLVAQVLMMAAGLLALWLVAPLAGGPGRRRDTRVLLAGLVLLPSWAVLAVRWAHPDDVLAMLLSVAAVRAVSRRRAGTAGSRAAVRQGRSEGAGWAAGRAAGRAGWRAAGLAGALVGAAVAAKPWAIGFAPILLALPGRQREPAVVAAGLAAGLAWVPFLIADSGTLAALAPAVSVADSSMSRLLGVRGGVVPAWTRTAQLVLAALAAMAAVARGRWPAALLVAIAVRLVLDPQDIGYYAGAAVLAAVVADLAVTGWLLPWTTAVTAAAFWQPFVADYSQRLNTAHGLSLWWFRHPLIVAAVHLAWAGVVLAAVLLLPHRMLARR